MKHPRLIIAVVSVGLIGGWLVWATGQASEGVRRAQCLDHLKWAITHLLNYHERHGAFPAGTIPNPQLPPERRLSWLVEFWDEQSSGVKLKVDRSKRWDEPPNWPPTVVAAVGVTFVKGQPDDGSHWVTCPDDPGYRARKPFPLTYVGVAGVGVDAPELPPKHPRAGIFGYDRVTKLEDITDGTSTTMAIIETTLGHGPWTAGGPSSVRGVDTTARPYIGRNRPFGGYHPGGANVAFADGSVRFVKDTIAPNIFEAIATAAGGEELPHGHRDGSGLRDQRWEVSLRGRAGESLLPSVECWHGAAFPSAELCDCQTACRLATNTIAPEPVAPKVGYSCHTVSS